MNNNRADTYAINIVVLASLWAANEIFIGRWLKSVNIFSAGLYLSFFSVLMVIFGKKLAPVIGSVFLMGIIAAFFKFLFTGFNANVPFLALIIQAAIGEGVWLILRLNLTSALLTGILIHCYTAFHPILHGSQLIKSRYYLQFSRWVLAVQPSASDSDLRVPLYLLVVHALLGILSGIIAWFLTGWLLKWKRDR